MLDEPQIRRFARHIVLPEVGGLGQERLLAARVLIVGAGGLGSPLALYLAAAGVGTLGIVDDDVVEESNLQRQVAHGTHTLGRPKTASLAARLADLSPTTNLRPFQARLTAANASDLIGGWDLVADGSDGFATRDAVQSACLALRVPLVFASVQGVSGQLSTFKPHLGAEHPCLRCLFPAPPLAGTLPSCSGEGVLGPAAGVVGTLQAVEVVKELLTPEACGLSGTLLLYDAMAASLDRLSFRRRAGCSTCGGALSADPDPAAM